MNLFIITLVFIALFVIYIRPRFYKRPQVILGCKVYVAQSTVPRAGNGVFARVPLRQGQVIETCPALVLKEEDLEGSGPVKDYVFMSVRRDGTNLLAHGNCGLFNHSDTPNAAFDTTLGDDVIISATQDIAPGEEIFISYGPDYWRARNQVPRRASSVAN